MLHKTRGIAFRYTKYGESSIIANIFTEHFGLQSYIVNGIRSKSSKNKIALFQPLTLLDLVIYHRENANILRIKEIRCALPYVTLLSDVKKSTLAIFISEILNKSVKEQSHSQQVFDFIFESLATLDLLPSGYENFHLIFLIKLSRFLGFGANHPQEILDSQLLGTEEENILKKLLLCDYQASLTISQVQRRNLLDILIRFYATHVDHFGEVRSVQILREVLS